MTFYEYSSDYFPIAPTCQIYLEQGNGQLTLGPLKALIDTGSDMTIIPIDYLRQIKAKRISRGRARSIWGDSRIVDIYMATLILDDLKIPILQVLADDRGDEIVIGRPVLDRFKIMLDGPAAIVELVSSI